MQHCADGEEELKQIFSLLHQHLNAREGDLMQELHTIRDTAGKEIITDTITLSSLQQRSEIVYN